MGGVGSSADNALAESFNTSLERENLQDRRHWPDAATCRREVICWLARYNIRRRPYRFRAAICLVAMSPFSLALMLLLRLSSAGPIFFRQPRIGGNGGVFDCLGFRSMRLSKDSDSEFALDAGSAPGGIDGADRRTFICKIMRSTSLDEQPRANAFAP